MRTKRSIALFLAAVMMITSTATSYADVYENTGMEQIAEIEGDEIKTPEEVEDVSINLPETSEFGDEEAEGADGTEPEEEEPVLYTLTLKLGTTGGGTLKSYNAEDEAVSTFEAGDTVKITATQNNHFYFKNWVVLTGDVSFNDPGLKDNEFEMPEEDVTLMAYYDEDPYVDVNYIPGRTEATATSVYYAKKYIGTNLTLRTKTYNHNNSDKYYQSGWSINNDGSTLDYKVGATYTLDEPITLYPYFAENHTVLFYPDENCVETEPIEKTKYAGASLSIATSYFTAKDPQEDVGMYGWCISGNDSARAFTTSIAAERDEDLILVPCWEKRYKITYLPGPYGSSITGEDDLYTYRYQAMLTTASGRNNLAYALFSRPGYIQTGWNTKPDGKGTTYTLNKGANFTSDMTLYPVWHVNYNITYNPGPESDDEPVIEEKIYNYAYTIRNTPFYRNGYTQTGWVNKAVNPAKDYAFGASYSSNSDMTLYPVWEENIYPIYVEGEQIRGSNCNDILGDGTLKYDSKTNTLIFNSADVSANDEHIIKILANAGEGETKLTSLNIEYKGDNKIQSLNGSVFASEIPLNFVGDGTLEIITDFIDTSFTGEVSVDKDVQVIGGNSEEEAEKLYYAGSALLTYKYLRFEPKEKENRKGVLDEYVYIGGTRITRGNLSGQGWQYDIESETLTITDVELINFSTFTRNNKTVSCGIYSDYNINLVINGINALGNDVLKPDYGIYARGTVTISGSGAADIYGTHGIYSAEDVVIEGGNVSIHAEKNGVAGNGGLSISNSSVEINSDSFGVFCVDDVIVNSGKFSINAAEAGISTMGYVRIGEADVDIKGGDEGVSCWGFIQNGGNASIVTLNDYQGNENEGFYNYALYITSADLVLNGGMLYAEAQYQAVYVNKGDLILDGGRLKARDRTKEHYKNQKDSNVYGCVVTTGAVYMYNGEIDVVGYAQALFLLSSGKEFEYHCGHVYVECTSGTSKVYCTNFVMTTCPPMYWYRNSPTATTMINAATKLSSSNTNSKVLVELVVGNTVSYCPGTGIDGEQVNVSKVSGIPLRLKGAIFSKPGFVQTGWATSENGPKVYDLNETFTTEKSIILYPFWSESVIIKYYKDAESEPIAIEKPLGKKINLQGRIFEKEGHLQNGWSTSVTDNDPDFELGAEYDEDISLNLYATWRDKANVTYLPGSRGRGTAITIGYRVLTDEKLSDRLFARPGYFQSGWSYTDGGDKDFELFGTVNLSEDITLYPYWTEGYVVEYREGTAPGAGMIERKEDVTENDVYFISVYGTELTIPEAQYNYIAAPGEYSEYIQLGWSYTDNGDLDVNFGDTYTLTDNYVLYPAWAKDSMWVDVVSDEYANVTPKERVAVYNYTGAKITPEVVVYDGSKKLAAGKDYTIAVKNNINASMTAADCADGGYRVTDVSANLTTAQLGKLPSITVTGKGDYSGKQVVYFSIKPVDIGTDAFADSGNTTIEYAEKKGTVVVNKPVPTITGTVNGKAVKLAANKDFKVSYIGKSVFEGEELAGIAYVGEYYMVVKGTGNYTGQRTFLATITNKKSVFMATIKNAGALNYTGGELVHPDLQVVYGKVQLKRGVDYTVSYRDNVNVGTGIITITGMGEYEGIRDIPFAINGTDFKKVKIEGFAKAYNYTGSEIEQNFVRFYVENPDETMHFLIKDEDYTAEYSNNILPGVATVTFKGLGGFTGELKKTFKINGVALSKATVENMPKSLSMVYSGSPKTLDGTDIYLSMNKLPIPELSYEEYLNHEDGYYVSYITDTSKKGNNVNAGTANVEFIGSGKYTGSIKKTFKITPYDIKADADNKVILYYEESITFSKGGAKALTAVCMLGDNDEEILLTENVDYKVAYKNNTAVGGHGSKKVPQFTITGKGNLKGAMSAVQFEITVKSLEDVRAVAADKAATGKAGAFAATVTLTDTDGKALKAGTDYDKNITYIYMDDVSVNNGGKEIMRHTGDTADKKDIVPSLSGGTHMKAVVTGKTNYEGIVELDYRITAQDIKTCKVEFNKKFFYNGGKPVMPTADDYVVKAKVGKDWVELDPSQYYVDAGSFTGTTAKGTASFVILGQDGFGGSLTVKYTILPKGIIWWFSQL